MKQMWPHHCRGLRDLILPPAMMGPRVGLDAVIVSELSPFASVMFSSTPHACLPFKRHFANPVFFPSPLLSPRFVSKASGSLCVFANNHVIVLVEHGLPFGEDHSFASLVIQTAMF